MKTSAKSASIALVVLVLASFFLLSCGDDTPQAASTPGGGVAQAPVNNSVPSAGQSAPLAHPDPQVPRENLISKLLPKKKPETTATTERVAKEPSCHEGFSGFGQTLMAVPYAIAEVFVIVGAILWLTLCFAGSLVLFAFGLVGFLFGVAGELFAAAANVISHGFAVFPYIAELTRWYVGNC